jgi:hypothetical protein
VEVFFRGLVQVDICGGVYFCQFAFILKLFLTFVTSSKTEVGSAGEQPARDTLDERQKCQCNGLSMR